MKTTATRTMKSTEKPILIIGSAPETKVITMIMLFQYGEIEASKKYYHLLLFLVNDTEKLADMITDTIYDMVDEKKAFDTCLQFVNEVMESK